MTGTLTTGKKPLQVGPNMTPMVDVVMCILIFFMLGSSFLVPEWWVKAPLAKGQGTSEKNEMTAATMPAVRLWVRLERRDGVAWVRAFDAAERRMNAMGAADQASNVQMAEYFAKKGEGFSPDVQVLIQPQGGVPYQDLITVYEWCVKAKLRQVAFTM